MTHRSKNLQPNLFEVERPCVELRPKQEAELAATLEALLHEIATSLAKAASGGSGDDQDHD
jgi:ribosomal protein L29